MKNILIVFFAILTLTIKAQTAEEIEMVHQINEIRINPKSFIPVIENYIKTLEVKSSFNDINIKGARVTKKTNNISVLNTELILEANALIQFLNTVKPLKNLHLSSVLRPIAQSQADFLSSNNKLGHTGSNGESLNTRTKRTGLNLIGENCAKGEIMQAIINLLIDFKVEDKTHRNNIFNKDYTEMSAAKTGNFWVLDFGGK